MDTQRPLKEGSVRTYQEKVALGFPDILASEMDADLDTIYAAWNGGMPANSIGAAQIIDGSVGTPEIADGSVTTPKILDGNVTTAKLLDGNVTQAKIGTDVSQMVRTDLSTPGSLGQNSTAWTTILDMTSTVLLRNRMYRLMVMGSFAKAVACDLALSMFQANVNTFYGLLSPSTTTSEVAWFFLTSHFLLDTGGGVYSGTSIDLSGATSGGANSSNIARSLIKVANFTGGSTNGLSIQIVYTVANVSNGVSRLQSTLELL